MLVTDTRCRVEEKNCDWGWDMETEGAFLFSEGNWFDHLTPFLTQAQRCRHKHRSHTSLGRRNGPRLSLERESINAGYWAKKVDENNIHLKQLFFFLSAFHLLHPNLQIHFLVLHSILHFVSFFKPSIWVLSFSGFLAVMTCCSWHIINFPRWWWICETASF